MFIIILIQMCLTRYCMSALQEKRNFLRNPPTGIQFNFDYESSYPVALVMLDEDPNLESMRFELVPKQYVIHLFPLM